MSHRSELRKTLVFWWRLQPSARWTDWPEPHPVSPWGTQRAPDLSMVQPLRFSCQNKFDVFDFCIRTEILFFLSCRSHLNNNNVNISHICLSNCFWYIQSYISFLWSGVLTIFRFGAMLACRVKFGMLFFCLQNYCDHMSEVNYTRKITEFIPNNNVALVE